MSKYEFLQPKFTEGVLAKSLQGRSSEEFYSYGFKSSKNLIPTVSGPLVKRPGTNYIGDALNSTSRFIPFFKDQDNTYILELSFIEGSSNTTLHVWSQDQKLKTATDATADYQVTGLPWNTLEILNSLKTTQSGDVIFVCSPTMKPYKITRTLDATNSARASDNSIWTVSVYEMDDGPYNAVNIYSDIDNRTAFTLKIKTEPNASSHRVEVANVDFNTVNNTIVLANHGLQTGMKIRLDDDGQNTDTYESAHASSGNHGWGYLTTDGNQDGSTVLTDSDYFVISADATTFQVSTIDGGDVLEFELRKDGSGNPRTKSNAKVKLFRYAYDAEEDVIFQIYNKQSTSSANHAITKTLISSGDVGRLIRINPLKKPNDNIGGVRWTWGVIKTYYNYSHPDPPEIEVTLKSELSNTRGTYGTPDFRLGAFADSQGWPQVSQIYQQRMVLAANTFQPSTIWLSKTGDFYSFAPTELNEQGSSQTIEGGIATEIITDANALTFTLDSDTLDAIKWLGDSKKLAMGTSAGVYMLYGSETNLVVTPTRFTINRETSFSATDTAPVVVSNALLYPQIGGKDLQMLTLNKGFSGQWDASKISLKGYDIIKTSEITKLVWQERPNAIIWCLMADGRLLSLSFDVRLEFTAWAEHVIGGTDAKVLDIEMIPKASHDQIWLKVSRTIDGQTKYYVETLGRFPSEGALERNDYVFSDSAITKTIGNTFTASNNSSQILITSNNHGLVNTQIVRFTSSGTPVDLPANLSVDTDYYVRDSATNTFKVATASGGSAIAYSDAGTGTHSWSTSNITGLKHLKGQTVQVYNDGMQHIDRTVTTTGGSDETITLNHYESSEVVVGLPYNSEIDTLEPPAPQNQFSYSKRLIKIAVIVEDSLGIQLDFNDLSEELLFRTMADSMGRQIDLFSGTRKLSLSGIGWDVHTVKISSNGPLPMQINSIIIEAETGGS